MALLPGELAQIVWAETKLLGFGRADGTGDINDIRRLVAQLAASTEGAGFDKRDALPPTTDPLCGDTVRGIMAIVEGAKDARPPQSRLIIWSAGGDGSRPDLNTRPPPPPPWGSIAPAAIIRRLRQGLSDGRVVDVYSRAPVAGEQDGAPFVNGLTGTGVPGGGLSTSPGVAAPMSDERKKALRRGAWWLGSIGFVLLILGAAMSVWSGRSMSGARNLLSSNNAALQSAFLQEVSTLCGEEIKQLPGGPQAAACKNLSLMGGKVPDDRTQPVLDAAKACAADVSQGGCSTIWRAAVAVDQNQAWKTFYFGPFNSVSAWLTGPSASAGSGSIVVPFVVIVIGIAAMVIALGLGTKQRVAGVWIDTRNRVSLARAQVTLWSIVALAGYAALMMFNVGMSSILNVPGDFSIYNAFPSIPASVAAALGIAVGSPMLSALILPTKDKDQPDLVVRGADSDLSKRGVPFFGTASDGLDKRDSPAQASIADIFMGEEKADADTVDVSRLQNVVITVTLVLGFFSLLIAMTSAITPDAIMKATKLAPIFTSLPNPGATFASLLLVSHATYLVAKAHDSQSPRPASGGDGSH